MSQEYPITNLGEQVAIRIEPSIASSFTEAYELAQTSSLPDELQRILTELVMTSALLTEKLHIGVGWRFGMYIEAIVKEAADAEQPQEKWEMFLDLLSKEAVKQDDTELAALAGRALPLLQAHHGPPGEVSLREVTPVNVRVVCLLSETLNPPRSYFVAPNAVSLAQALVTDKAWYRVIYAGEVPVGFLMLYDDPEEPAYFLWRMMTAGPFQGRGYGKRAIELLADYVRTRPGAKELLVSYGQGEGSPEAFYRKVGFIPTGEMEGIEAVARIKLDAEG
jgi:diamine N-acetyltransferase